MVVVCWHCQLEREHLLVTVVTVTVVLVGIPVVTVTPVTALLVEASAALGTPAFLILV